MNETPSHTNLLNLGKTQTNAWSKRDYARLKTNQNIKNSIRGSKLIQEIIQNLRIQTHTPALHRKELASDEAEEEPNFQFQHCYGRLYSELLQEKFVKLSNLLKMRKQEDCRSLLEIRSRMVDWMLEVFTVYCKGEKGSNETTYFKAVDILDRGINSKLINAENIHIYGIASMFLASSPLDRRPITLQEAYQDLGHETFKPVKIQQHIHLLAKEIGFKLTNPTLVEYMDKLVFDIFGDYRKNIATFNIRQFALFVLQCTLYDVKFQSHHPKVVCTMALLHSIEAFFTEYEKKDGLSAKDRLSAAANKENLYCAVISESRVEKSQLNALLNELNEHLKLVRANIENGDFQHLGAHFSYNFVAPVAVN